jgi:hypothetical protein
LGQLLAAFEKSMREWAVFHDFLIFGLSRSKELATLFRFSSPRHITQERSALKPKRVKIGIDDQSCGKEKTNIMEKRLCQTTNLLERF